MGRITFQGQSWQNVVKLILAKRVKSAIWVAVGRFPGPTSGKMEDGELYLKNNLKEKKVGSVTQVVQCLPSKCKVLN
jgi:hypothetical protein